MTDANQPVLKTHDVIGKPVISLQGEEIGTIVRVIVDPEINSVIGLTVNVRGFFKGEKGIEFANIGSFGDYAVVVENSREILPLDNLPEIEKMSKELYLYNMRVVTPLGKLIGTIDDFCFDAETGRIEKYILSGGIIKNLFKGMASIPASSIITIGKDLLITTDGVEQTIQKEESGLQDSLENIKGDIGELKIDLDQWKDDFEKTWDKTRNKVLDLSKIVGENLLEAARTGSGKGKEVLSKTSELVNEKIGQLKSSYDWWVDRLQAAKNRPDNALPEHDVNILIGLVAGKTVTDLNGKVIVAENEEITKEVIECAHKAGKTGELLISIATKDLEDKMKHLNQ